MSSIYRLICLSHDPGLVLETEWQSGEEGHHIAEAALRTPARSRHEDVRQHEFCDLVIGRYSASLIEIGYLPYNTNVHWVNVEWIRMAASFTTRAGHEQLDLPRGWTWERLRRLRPTLGFDQAEPEHATMP